VKGLLHRVPQRRHRESGSNFMKTNIQIHKGDITKLELDAIVNAANTTLLGGGGVDGAIHRDAGPGLLEECKSLNGCPTGEAKITKGYNLSAKYVIHTVGPVWNGGNYNEDELLANCYRNSLKLAAENKIRSVAFPAISTGVYRFPLERATKIAVDEVTKFFNNNDEIEKIIFVAFDEATYDIYNSTLNS
jgi:O-acetyl-ADP-ribose deacetylase (regulator of RNase III)